MVVLSNSGGGGEKCEPWAKGMAVSSGGTVLMCWFVKVMVCGKLELQHMIGGC